jgi:hypothetical protein
MSDILINSVLTDALITLAHAFKEAGVNPPKKIEVDSPTFDKLLSESMTLYNIDSKKAVTEREFRLSDTIPNNRAVIHLVRQVFLKSI